MKKLLINCLVFASFVATCVGSAIPMWEYLSKDEKMSHLYSMFAKQVQTHCKNNMEEKYVSQCKRELMMYGLSKLQDMEESHLDVMDPYQRGATDLIWGSMMDGHSSMKNEHGQNQKQNYGTFDQKKPIHHKKENYIKAQKEPAINPLFDDNRDSSYDMETSYQQEQYPEYNGNHLQQGAATNVNYNYAIKPNDLDQQAHLELDTNFLTGPMVIRVMPDGTPVDSNVKMPSDDDKVEMMIGRERMPTMHELSNGFVVMDETPKIIMQMPPNFHKKVTPQATVPVVLPPQRTVRTLYSSYRTAGRNINGH